MVGFSYMGWPWEIFMVTIISQVWSVALINQSWGACSITMLTWLRLESEWLVLWFPDFNGFDILTPKPVSRGKLGTQGESSGSACCTIVSPEFDPNILAKQHTLVTPSLGRWGRHTDPWGTGQTSQPNWRAPGCRERPQKSRCTGPKKQQHPRLTLLLVHTCTQTHTYIQACMNMHTRIWMCIHTKTKGKLILTKKFTKLGMVTCACSPRA